MHLAHPREDLLAGLLSRGGGGASVLLGEALDRGGDLLLALDLRRHGEAHHRLLEAGAVGGLHRYLPVGQEIARLDVLQLRHRPEVALAAVPHRRGRLSLEARAASPCAPSSARDGRGASCRW